MAKYADGTEVKMGDLVAKALRLAALSLDYPTYTFKEEAARLRALADDLEASNG